MVRFHLSPPLKAKAFRKYIEKYIDDIKYIIGKLDKKLESFRKLTKSNFDERNLQNKEEIFYFIEEENYYCE